MKNLAEDTLIKKSSRLKLFTGNNKYFQIFGMYPHPVLIINPADLSIKEVNKAASAFYGFDRNLFLKKNLYDIDPSLMGKSKSYISKLLKQKNFKSLHTIKDKSTHKVNISTGILNEKGRIYFSLFVTSDSNIGNELLKKSPGQQTEKGNKDSSIYKDDDSLITLSFALIESIRYPVLIRDGNKVFFNCNTEFERLLGYSKKFMVNKNIQELFDGEIAAQIEKLDKQSFVQKRLSFNEISLTKDDGVEKKYLVTSNPIYRDNNKLSFIISVFTDISGSAILQNCEKVFSEREKQLNDLKLRFLSTTSHEFRTPLTTILTSSELLLMIGRTLNEERYVEYIYQIQNAVNYMTSLLDDILTVNKTEVGKWKFSPSKIDLFDFLHKLVEEAKNNGTPNHNIIIDYKLKENNAIVDNKLLQHILSNLLSNAIKYSPNGGNIILKVKASKSDFDFTIVDNGIGISKKDQKNLFETFYRGHNTGKIEGTGMGLSIVKRCVESHGGKISFKSELNKGSTFTVSIPMMTII